MKAIGESGSFFGQPLPAELAEFIGKLGQNISSLSVWVIVSIILTFYPIEPIIDIFYFVTKYLILNADGINIRSKIRHRVIPVIDDVLANYQQVTIVSHSFGVIIGTDILADYQNNKSLNYLTLGGVLKILSYKSRWILKEIEKCCNNQILLSWTDYYSQKDWFAAKTPQPKTTNSHSIQITSHQMPIYCSIWEQLSGKTHSLYLYNPTWIVDLLKLNN
ncbi:MAG: hypothetical protein QNJ68_03835 [Microcoleaceae cyanobacterium MO_207.B10]|nr:hypothetical protein [Microcoleaceae cyanobacterium MO_207.B10]